MTEHTGIHDLVGTTQTLVIVATVADIRGADDGVGTFVEDGSTADVAVPNSRDGTQTRSFNLGKEYWA